MKRWGVGPLRPGVAALALLGTLAVPMTASAGLLEQLVVELEGDGAADAIVTYSAVDIGTGSVVAEVSDLLPKWLQLGGLLRLVASIPNILLGTNQHWSVRVDARFADGPVRVKQFKLFRLLGKDRYAKVHSNNLAGSCEWFVLGDEVGE
jgi:hypothetical protein